MTSLVLLGLLASAFFSATFILNRAMSLTGGHWVWSAALRYFYMLILLSFWIGFRRGSDHLKKVFLLYWKHPAFWTLAGGVGFGIFYAGLCFAADHAPGWIVAATWQSTILATPVVLFFFKRRVPVRGVLFAAAVFMGIVFVNAGHFREGLSLREVLMGVVPVLIAAFAYPTGNQMLNTVCHDGLRRVPSSMLSVLNDAPSCVLIMTLGSIPFWLVLIAVSAPPEPAPIQWLHTALVAVSSGVVATSIFYKARNATRQAMAIAAVDATQSGEVVFSLLGEVFFLAGAWPDLLGTAGLILIVGGLTGYCLTGRGS